MSYHYRPGSLKVNYEIIIEPVAAAQDNSAMETANALSNMATSSNMTVMAKTVVVNSITINDQPCELCLFKVDSYRVSIALVIYSESWQGVTFKREKQANCPKKVEYNTDS